MAVKRVVSTAFWTDGKVDEFSPEDKYFMLYLLTNPFTKQLGIYEISIKQAAFQLGYSIDTFNVLLERFENKYKMILFSRETSEIAILNFLCHSIMKGGKPVEDCLIHDIASVKDKKLLDAVFRHIWKRSDWDKMNVTVKKIVEKYLCKNGFVADNDNDNDNDNDRTGDESPHDSSECDCPEGEPKKPEGKPKKKAPSKKEIEDFFEEVWDLYPVKKGKGQVSESKRKTLYMIGKEEISRAIKRYLDELKKDADWRKPQNGSTFFNSGFIDYLDKNFSPQQRQGKKNPYPNVNQDDLDEVF